MRPTYNPGDHVLTFNWTRPKVGSVIVFRNVGKNYLKRVDKIENDFVYVFGDNKKEGAKMESVRKSRVVGKVILRY